MKRLSILTIVALALTAVSSAFAGRGYVDNENEMVSDTVETVAPATQAPDTVTTASMVVADTIPAQPK
ncbi:hypothetical protein [Xylanibacter muris]|uniref:Secreted protein n=1 Tax=Xylanibacter muris TaxID=2736290 RepID=A0ABX2AII9_9BACT|nr:hypothetical protein [Xylanibacter muris]NPD90786.1 hypothetical protein [Xylanibacter muris]